MSTKTYNIERFLEPQAASYSIALSEIKRGRKLNCWMWYIFPQLKVLGKSSRAKYYGIENLDEAKAYINDKILGARLIEVCDALLALETNNARQVFGSIDEVKLKSSMTLFEIAKPENDVFARVLEKFFDGDRDSKTIEFLKS